MQLRSTKTIFFVLSVIGLIGTLSYRQFYSKASESFTGPLGPSMRSIASIKDEVKKSEVFSLERKVFSKLENSDGSSQVLADANHKGQLFIDWIELKPSYKVGIFSIQMEGVSLNQVYAIAKISSDYKLLELKTTTINSENEEDAVLFIKDMISLYTFNTMEDTTGSYTATITLKDNLFTKKKMKYTDVTLAQIQIKTSNHFIETKRDILTKAWGEEETLMAVGLSDTKSSNVLSNQAYKIELLNPEKSAIALSNRKELIGNMELISSSIKLNQTATKTQKISWDKVKDALHELQDASGKQRMDLFHFVVKGLKSNPEKIEEYIDWAKTQMSDPAKSSIAIGALATLGTEKAQEKLIEMYKELDLADSQKKLIAHQVLNAMTTTEAVLSNESKAFLKTLITQENGDQSLAVNAAYALGNAIRKNNDPSSDNDLQVLISKANSANTTNTKLEYLDAIGNSGSTNALSFLIDQSKSSDISIRQKAIMSMRFINDKKVTEVISNALSDSNINIKESAIQAISFQKDIGSYTNVLKNCSVQDSNQQIQKMCGQLLENI